MAEGAWKPVLTRVCWFCQGMHNDRACDKRPKHFSMTLLREEWEMGSQNGSDSENSDTDVQIEHNTVLTFPLSHGIRRIRNADPVTIPFPERFPVATPAAGILMGSGLAYLSAEPCPMKSWIGVKPTGAAALTDGVINSGGMSVIDRNQIPEGHEILTGPRTPAFQGLGDAVSEAIGYVVLPVHIPNKPAYSGDVHRA